MLSPVETLPVDREIYIVTDECEVQQVAWCDRTHWYTGENTWRRTDGESGGWDACEIRGWSDDRATAEGAAAAALPAFEAECAAFRALIEGRV